MTETTQETIKFARSWLGNAEKYGDPNAPTTGTMTALARAVMELADEVEKLESINMDHLEELDRQEWLLDNANEELAALKEKMRWRDENVEPAPRGERVLVYCIDYDASDGVHDTEMEHMYCPDGELAYPYTWWRPLDLPNLPEGDAK